MPRTPLLWLATLGACSPRDDWQYSPPPWGDHPELAVGAAVILTFLLLVGLAMGLIIGGRKRLAKSRSRRRRIGVWLLILLFLITTLGLVALGTFTLLSSGTMMMASMSPAADQLGFATGGAKDVANFRSNIAAGFLPQPSDITTEGLFYDYAFDTGQKKPCEALFCPSYSRAVTLDPSSGQEETWLAVGLNSGLQADSFQRKRLDLVVVLDISGSMNSAFDSYYYDKPAQGEPASEEPPDARTKMQVANEAVVAALTHLQPEDRFGMVLFDDDAYLAKPLRAVADTDMDRIAAHVLDLKPMGGTAMGAGMALGSTLFDEEAPEDAADLERRILFLTDAMPNTGDISAGGMFSTVQQNAERGVYTTFVGIGVDFNSELVEAITKIRGANYLSVHSGTEFRRRMDEEFEYLVTPLVFDLELTLESAGWRIEEVHGSPEADLATGTLMRVNTLFPSPSKDGETRGGLVLLRLARLDGPENMALRVSYEDRLGVRAASAEDVSFSVVAPEYFDNNGIRKGVLLARYAGLMRSWLQDARETPVPADDNNDSHQGRWERPSRRLVVPPAYQDRIAGFQQYFQREQAAIGDPDLAQELELMGRILNP